MFQFNPVQAHVEVVEKGNNISNRCRIPTSLEASTSGPKIGRDRYCEYGHKTVASNEDLSRQCMNRDNPVISETVYRKEDGFKRNNESSKENRECLEPTEGSVWLEDVVNWKICRGYAVFGGSSGARISLICHGYVGHQPE